ncbi:hypothetical protein [Parasitella parasitica]|uniref:Proteasome activator Blm10 mid region domain-containing protein n=1 Tax=Parasitella parasitica TaxID=35722 RepID=A0A0B7N208_9FUNG|nr:hypothetical protein [Parasitella parasitica]
MIPLSVVKDDEDHTMHYAQSLPYADKLEHEAGDWLESICTNLTISIKAKDFKAGAVAWTKRLSNYLDMKHALPRETRANLAKLLFEMAIMPGMDYTLIDFWSNNCIRLIRHKKRLDPEDLELEWRPLYKLIERTLFPKNRQRTMLSESKYMATVLRLVEYAQRFFPPNAAAEILQEFLPKFTTHSIPDAMRAQGYLVLFLPVEYRAQHTTHAEDYLPTIFSLWSIYTNSNVYDSQFTHLVACIAENHLDFGSKEVGLFTKQQIQSIFTVGLRMFNLPVGSRSDGGSSAGGAAGGATTGYGNLGLKHDQKASTSLFLRRRPDKVKCLSRFIIYTIMPDPEKHDSSFSLSLLSDMIQATELYFHPSNHGSWSYLLTYFLRHLSSEFLKRWRREQEEDCTTPPHRRLTLEIRREFVLMLRPVLYISMFGKDHFTVSVTQATLKSLAWLEPSLIFPGLLERIYPSLETLTETHRTSSALGILSDIALPLFSRDNYAAGGKHLLPLLHLAIPGIDMNDPVKTIASLMFISTALMTIPIVDMSQQQDGYYPTEEFTDDPNAVLSRETEDYLVKATTGDFEEWLAKFMDRVFTIFENLPQENRKDQGSNSSSSSSSSNGPTMETGLTQMLLHTCDIIFGQLSNELYDLALRLVVEFVSDRVLPNAVRGVGLLCDAITAAQPRKAAKAFIPLCIANIQAELEDGAASTATHAAASNLIQSDFTFHWYQNILFSVICNLGPEILPYKQDIVAVARAMIQQCRSRRGMMWTGKLLRNVLMTLINIFPKDTKSMPPSQWNDEEFMSKHAHQLWGQLGDPANIEIQWHVPSEPEKDFALEFLAEFLTPSMQRLEQLISQEPANSHEISNEFCRHLAVVRNCLMGSSAMVGDDGVADPQNLVTMATSNHSNEDDSIDNDDDETAPMPQQNLVVGYAFSDPTDPRTEQARSIRRSIGLLIHKLSDFFRTKREDDVESIKILIKIARSFLSERGVEKEQFDRSKAGYSYAKNIGRTPHCKKRYPRNLLVRRAYNHHLLRLRQNNQSRLRTPLHDAILSDLVEMSLGSYAEIRKVSQNALSATSRCFRGVKHLIIPVLLEALEPNVPADRMKGALYLFSHKCILGTFLRDWLFLPAFVRAMCRAQHQDKLSIQGLIRRVFSKYSQSFNAFSFKILTPNDLSEYLKSLSPATVATPEFSSTVAQLERRLDKKEANNDAAYQEVMDFLLNFLQEPQVHWRYVLMATNFIDLFTRCQVRASRSLAEFANNATVSELPATRTIGFLNTAYLLLAIKQRTLAAGNEDLLITGQVKNPLKIEIPVADSTTDAGMGRRLLAASYQALTVENAAESVLVDDTTVGWYVWPSHYTGYKINTKDFLFDTVEPQSQEAYDEFQKTFSSAEYWSKLCAYIAEEVSQREEDRFNHVKARLFTSIFQMFGDGPLDSAREHVEKLCHAADQKNSQRAASEILAGLIRGTKHWSLAKLSTVWLWLTPLLGKVFSSITPDSLTYWESFIRYVANRRDPRRIQPLIDLLLGAQLDPTSDAAFSESRKILLVRQLAISLQWRFEPLNQRILPTYLSNIQHPYKQVREVIGVNINELLQLEWIPSYPSVRYLLEANALLADGVGNVPTKLNARQQERVAILSSRLDAWLLEMNQNNSSEKSSASDYAHASKTVLCWLHEALNHWCAAGTLPYIAPMLPKIFAMQEANEDQDLQQMATRVLGQTARVDYPPSMLPTMIDEFLKILTTSTNWHVRVRALPLLQIFFFKHLFAMSSAQLLRIMQVIGQMLLDTQIEVRQLASVTLGGLVRCSQRDAIEELLAEFTAKIQVKIPKRRRDKVTGKNIEPAGFADAVLHKHAGVLGISCLVSAFPYEVPEWMPAILCQLADCMSDPAAEIQATIRKTFSDFRRTHSDTWHEDMLKFDENQLSILSDMLISPSYYA